MSKNNEYSGEMTASENNKVEKASKGKKTYEVSFTQRRSFELKIGRRMYYFDTNNKTAKLSEDEINHPDFIQQRRYFSVREA